MRICTVSVFVKKHKRKSPRMMGCVARIELRPRHLLALLVYVLLYGTLATAMRLTFSSYLDVRSQDGEKLSDSTVNLCERHILCHKIYSSAREIMKVSASDIDDGNNSLVYSLSSKKLEDAGVFRIDRDTGIISLNKHIERNPGYKFTMIAIAENLGEIPKSIDVDITIVEPQMKRPSFAERSTEPIKLYENFANFSAILIELRGISGDLMSTFLMFDLRRGRTEETNNKNTFRMKQTAPDRVGIMMAQHLDYESITHYTLTVQVRNTYALAAETQIDIEILDVNDNVPVFREVKSGSVLENEPIGVHVIQVQAIDADGTSANNQITYKLENNKDYFAIDPQTGNITTLVTFDRERQDIYYLHVIATDNSPSALFNTGEHNKGEQKFSIEIADKNDNPPYFDRKLYIHNYIDENTNINADVTEVKAIDPDTASPVTYSIISGNTDDSFRIEGTTGRISVNKQLDYERITKYNLTVRAFDGVFNDTAQVEIFIVNVNDNPPVFLEFNKNLIIEEEKLINECITVVKAYDPDIEDKNGEQYIVYSIVKKDQQPLIKINEYDGCIQLKEPLDRDPPFGYSTWNVLVAADDEHRTSISLREVVMVNITLTDINDNAPFLDIPYPIIWYENFLSSKITDLKARDYDSEENGPPFKYRIDDTANDEIKSKFYIHDSSLFTHGLFAQKERKSYNIPITITDSGIPPMTSTSTLTVIVAGKNDM